MTDHDRHRLHVYTGDGKGKTTSAMGLAFRMLGHGRPVLIAQFMKKPNSGELVSFSHFAQATVQHMPDMPLFTFQLNEKQLKKVQEQQSEALRSLLPVIEDKKPALTVLDELNMALFFQLVDRDAAEAVVDAALQHGDVAVTGRQAPDWLKEKADYVSVITPEKHPFNEGLPAREGIEW